MTNKRLNVNGDLDKISAMPTKNLFITMLVRDLTLRDAIGDLVDNSVDGAKSIAKNNSYSGLEIRIVAEPEEFRINDNCGGFSVEVARKYAFCFGRQDGSPELEGSIGRFGIGMKRALFKLGSFFEIGSVSETTSFTMSEDVLAWSKKKEWDFKFNTRSENESNPIKDRGTKIKVTNLTNDVKSQFMNANFQKRLKEEIELEHLFAINKGLKIYLNGELLNKRTLDFTFDKKFKPGFWNNTFEKDFSVEILAGLSEKKGESGGWYIFCNERLIVGPDTTPATGWTGRKGDGVAEYHDQFHRFRGYVFFEAKNAELLPWNTTKTGMDMDSPIYKSVRTRMIEMMKPAMTAMNILKKEKEGDNPDEEKVLNNAINIVKPVPLAKVLQQRSTLPNKFTFPQPPPKKNKKDKGQLIRFYKPKNKLDEVKEYFDVKGNGDAGERAFDFFYEMEIE